MPPFQSATSTSKASTAPSPSCAAPSTIFLPTTSRTASSLTCSSHGLLTSPMSLATHELGIPRLIFHGMCFFSLCVLHLLEHCRPQDNVSSNDEPFIVPGLPHSIEMARSQLPTPLKSNIDFNRLLERMQEAEAKSYGMVVNSYYEREPHYAERYTKIIGKKAWCVRPVSLCNESTNYKVERASVDHGGCQAWLDSKMPSSVLYVCFGSLIQFTTAQLREIALGLEASGRAFIWVVRADGAEGVEWLSEGFHERSERRGMIIKGWAPQILILNHEAVGGFLTHCGWNSTLEGVSAGVSMVTCPIFADQSFNEKLVVDVLKIGVRVGARVVGEGEEEEEVVKSEKIEMAVDWWWGAERRRAGGGRERDCWGRQQDEPWRKGVHLTNSRTG